MESPCVNICKLDKARTRLHRLRPDNGRNPALGGHEQSPTPRDHGAVEGPLKPDDPAPERADTQPFSLSSNLFLRSTP